MRGGGKSEAMNYRRIMQIAILVWLALTLIFIVAVNIVGRGI